MSQGKVNSSKYSKVCFNFEGVIHNEFVQEGRSVDSVFYSEQLNKCTRSQRGNTQNVKGEYEDVLLQQDNDQPHIPRDWMQKHIEKDVIKLVPHLPFSPDLVPSEFYLFQGMTHFLNGKKCLIYNKVKIKI